MTFLQQQIAVAGLLPELIEYKDMRKLWSLHADQIKGMRFIWKDTNQEITPREWFWVVHEVVEWLRKTDGGKSVKNRHREYLINLWMVCNPGLQFSWENKLWISCINASFEQILTALCRTLWPERFK